MYKKLFNFYEIASESKFFLYIYLLFFFTSPHIKFLNLKLNIFDTGLYVSNLYQIYNIENLNGLFIGHAQIILYFFSFIFFLTDKYVVNLLVISESLSLIRPILICERNKINTSINS